jgi:Uma2 family endonuclease
LAVNPVRLPEPYLVTLGRLLSVEEFQAMPKEEGYKYELIDGRVYRVVTTSWHGRLVSRLTTAINSYAEEHDLGECLGETTGFDLPPHSRKGQRRSPDIGFVVKERLLPLSDHSDPFPDEPPDLVGEVVSEDSQDQEYMQDRATFWLNQGVRLVWVVWPTERLVQVWRPDQPMRSLSVGESLDGLDVLPGFQYPLERLFREH